LEAVLDRLVDRGWLTRPSHPKPRLPFPLPSLGLSAETATKLLDELRADRFEIREDGRLEIPGERLD
jgi:hypothetical protein